MTALRHRLASVALAGLLIAQPGWAGPPAAGAAPLKLPVATPDWRDQILYLALTDRFDDGDARNNRLGQGEFDRRHGTRNSGSDLAGLARRLDHIQGLGATALWLTARAEDQQLSHQLHQRGMYLVQDILLNHAGDSFADRRGADANGKTAYFKDPAGTPLRAALSPVPPNDVPNPAHRRALRQSHGAWIQSVGVDAFGPGRAFAIPSALPGGMLNVALSAALNDAFSRGAPSAQLAQRIAALKLHARPHGMLNLIDNPAGERYLAGGSSAGLQQAWLAMMTLPGIPTLYDGTEQGFTQPRTSMFAAGGGSGGRDPVHTAAALYRYFASLAELRRGHKVLSRGMPRVLHGNAAQAGALAWLMGGGDDSILVVMNSADHEVLLDSLEPGFMPATPLHPLFGIDGLPASASLDAQGRVTLRLPSRAGWVWRIGNRVAAHAGALAVATVGSSILGADGRLIGASPPIVLEPLPQREQSGDFTLRGQARPGRGLRLVLDGNLATARTLRMDAEGRFEARISTADMIDPAVTHRVLVVDLADLAGGAVSNALSFRVQPP